MTRVTYTGPARALRVSAHDIAVERDETIDVPDDVADQLVAEYDFERAAETDDEPDLPPGFGVLAETVPEAEERIETGAFDGQLGALANVEADHEDRKGVHEAIEERRTALAEESTE